MNITLKNCNNIAEGKISIQEGKLNIKYGSNGTGKSTIAKAIECKLTNEDSMKDLLPFKLRQDNPHKLVPRVEGFEGINSIKLFNEKYLEQFTFKPEELVANSFEIFIKTPEYEQQLQAIEDIIGKIKSVFQNDPNLESFLNVLRELSGSFKESKTGISKASSGYKALESGNKFEHIPAGLEAYAPFLKHSTNVTWIGWQQQGQAFMEISADCPFCTSPTADKKSTIERVSKEYDKTTINHLNKIISVFEKLGKYFSDDARKIIEEITKLKDGIQSEHERSLLEIKAQIDNLIQKLEQLKTLSGQSFKETEKVAEKLPLLRIDMKFFGHLNSADTENIVSALNEKLDELITDAGKLQGEINKQRITTQKLIEKNRNEINNFLSNAGYKYEVLITDVNSGHRLKLKHVECEEHVSGGNQHLSFGERNAFALVLFMFECLSKKPDLIVLDDPISSFDKDKKFAILDRLFLQPNSFKGKTVLLLTHDMEPVIDTTKTLKRTFQQSVAHFLKNSNGVLIEREIKGSDILSFAQICLKALDSPNHIITKLIYLRRYFEIFDDKGDAYQLISNAFKKRRPPLEFRNTSPEDEDVPMSPTAIQSGADEIKTKLKIDEFDYETIVSQIENQAELKNLYVNATNGYEKLRIYRLIDKNHKNSVIRKYINETYHIENDYICQLDPAEFDPVPQFVIDECDKVILETS